MSVVGTVPYLAPEVIRDRKCSKAMDVWSFGLVLWEVLTGATPFEGLGPGAVQLQVQFVLLLILLHAIRKYMCEQLIEHF